MKDIFIDNNVAKNFASPVDQNYKKLIQWLFYFDQEDVTNTPANIFNYAHLVVNQKLLIEYTKSSINCVKPTSIPVLINKLMIEGRLKKISNLEIKDFVSSKFNKRILKNFKSNIDDHIHITTILLSNRKIAISYDDNLKKDLKSIPGYNVIVESRPEDVNYEGD